MWGTENYLCIWYNCVGSLPHGDAKDAVVYSKYRSAQRIIWLSHNASIFIATEVADKEDYICQINYTVLFEDMSMKHHCLLFSEIINSLRFFGSSFTYRCCISIWFAELTENYDVMVMKEISENWDFIIIINNIIIIFIALQSTSLQRIK
jgi:hypothetical protein